MIIKVILVAIVLELFLKPRLDRTNQGVWLLWYGRKNRDYIKLN